MGLKITGIDSANLSGDEDVYDLTEEPVEIVRYKMSAAGARQEDIIALMGHTNFDVDIITT